MEQMKEVPGYKKEQDLAVTVNIGKHSLNNTGRSGWVVIFELYHRALPNAGR